MIDVSADREAIRTLIAAVKYQKDREDDPAAFAKLWSRDATYVVEMGGQIYGAANRGRDAVVAFNVRNWEAGAHGAGDTKETHLAEPPHIIDLGGGMYRSIYNVVMLGFVDGRYAPVGTGIFQDDCIREDGDWKIAARRAWLKRPK